MKETTDNFQPIALIRVFREQVRLLDEKIQDETISTATREFLKGARTAMAFAVVTVSDMAMAKDRFTAKERIL